MINNKFNLLLVAICSLSTLLSEAQCMETQEYFRYLPPKSQASNEQTNKRQREFQNTDTPKRKKVRWDDGELSEISKVFEKNENKKKKKKENLESQKKELERYLDINIPQRSPEDAYKAGIYYAFNVGEEAALEKENRLEKAVIQLKLAADQGNHKASYCLAIFYAMGWGCSTKPHNQNKEECIKYLEKSTNSYPKAKKLFEAYKKTPSYFNSKPEQDYKSHAQLFSNLFKSQEKKDHEFEVGIFKAFGWDVPQDMEDAATHLLCSSQKDSEDAYHILYLLRINEEVSIQDYLFHEIIDIHFINDHRNYSLTEGSLSHIDTIQDYYNLLKICSEKQNLQSKINKIEYKIKIAEDIKNKSIFLRNNDLESDKLKNRSNNVYLQTDKMEQVGDDSTEKQTQQGNEKNSSQATRPSNPIKINNIPPQQKNLAPILFMNQKKNTTQKQNWFSQNQSPTK